MNDWYACEYPERPPEIGATLFHRACRPCAVALHAAARLMPGHRMSGGECKGWPIEKVAELAQRELEVGTIAARELVD